ncbi:hypothetical protein [Marivita geojedonensis]|uniref:hypothetical protein n=1 Tax=Marivita geojedonensis TaxID=1123756 RepID=UPI0011B1E575|nr:hypothetical protein [Marivita geojedonensis]
MTLTEPGELQSIKVVSDKHGVYFGLARKGPIVFVAERNADIDQKPITPGDPVDVIRVYVMLPGGRLLPTPIRYGHKDFYDLHEIEADQNSLFVTVSKYPFLLKKSIIGSDQPLPVNEAVPSHLKRHDDHTFDAYHINCASRGGDHLYVLAHNWDDPSFAMRLSLKEAHQGRVVCTRVYENLGSCCHDIVPMGDVFWTLDSRGSALVRVSIETGKQDRFLLESPSDPDLLGSGETIGIPFPRGLARFGDLLAVSYGFNEDRADRMDSNAMLAVFDLKKEIFTNHIHLGKHGNTCAVLSL